MKLTNTIAKKVIRKALPYGKVVTRKPGISYVCSCGMITVYCDSDWFARNGKIHVRVQAAMADGVITLFFDPETLERDYDAEDAWREPEIIENELKECVRRERG